MVDNNRGGGTESLLLTSWYLSLADSGEGHRGTLPPPPLIFRPNWGPKGEKNYFSRPVPPLSQGLDDRAPPYLRVWMTGLPLISGSGWPGPPLSQGLDDRAPPLSEGLYPPLFILLWLLKSRAKQNVKFKKKQKIKTGKNPCGENPD